MDPLIWFPCDVSAEQTNAAPGLGERHRHKNRLTISATGQCAQPVNRTEVDRVKSPDVLEYFKKQQ
jgi:hypothetical protein